MLAKKYRLNRAEINLIYKKGSGKNFGAMGIKFLANSQVFPRFAIVIPGVVIKKAIARNRYRRVMYDEIGRILKSKDGFRQNNDYIIRLYKVTADEKILRKTIREIAKSV